MGITFPETFQNFSREVNRVNFVNVGVWKPMVYAAQDENIKSGNYCNAIALIYILYILFTTDAKHSLISALNQTTAYVVVKHTKKQNYQAVGRRTGLLLSMAVFQI